MRHEGDSRLGVLRIPRSRGAASGLLLVLLGVWGALIPFVGPYFDFAFTPDTTWTWTSGRFWLEVLPGGAAVLGGLVLLLSADRVSASLGGWLAAAAGAWFVVGPALAPLWDPGTVGQPIGGTTRQALEWVTFFYGLGALIVFLAAVALGRLTVRGVRDVEVARRYRERRLAQHAPDRTAAPVAPTAEEQVYPSDAERARSGASAATEPAAELDDDRTRRLGRHQQTTDPADRS